MEEMEEADCGVDDVVQLEVAVGRKRWRRDLGVQHVERLQYDQQLGPE